MANRTIKNRFKNLYNEFKDNLSNESCNLLEQLCTLDCKSLYEYQNNLVEALLNEAVIISIESEKKFPIEKLIEADYENLINNYFKVIIILQEDIGKAVKTLGYSINKNVEINDENYIHLYLTEEYKKALEKIKKEFNITGEVIHFILKIANLVGDD